jgi:hypothetical protein
MSAKSSRYWETECAEEAALGRYAVSYYPVTGRFQIRDQYLAADGSIKPKRAIVLDRDMLRSSDAGRDLLRAFLDSVGPDVAQ